MLLAADAGTWTGLPPEGAGQDAVSGMVKFYDPLRGYGFVLVGPDRRDAMLHSQVLRRSGLPDPVQGDRLTCTVRTGERGLYVAGVSVLDHQGVPPPAPPVQMDGRVKFYDVVRGYGFILLETGAEVFVGAKLLRKLGLTPLRDQQAVRVTASHGPQGLVAETLTFTA